ncbi:uncharacterized protein VTP21DRAFT_10602 [Calcarisporiella thermophila]|uniref:uncharacterized protein n=1 Tax=Calcarisporiella thermophila TaxID=911321 RepID=UPI003742067A
MVVILNWMELNQSANSRKTYNANVISSKNARKKFYGVPLKNNAFVERPIIINKIGAALEREGSSNECKIVALKGLGGMGKTQLMLRYCYTPHKRYDYVFWLNVDGWSMAGRWLSAPSVNWQLKINSNWLLLLDNVDIEVSEKIYGLLPREGGDIIITTQEPIQEYYATVIDVGKMEEEEALFLLLRQDANSINRDSLRFHHACSVIHELDYIPFTMKYLLIFLCITVQTSIVNRLHKIYHLKDWRMMTYEMKFDLRSLF